MFPLTDEQITFIQNDIARRGIALESLRDNLLDHICCILERDKGTETDFENTYHQTINSFFKRDLKEIEDETRQLLKNKYFYSLKKWFYIFLITSLTCNVFLLVKVTLDVRAYNETAWFFESNKDATLAEGTKHLLQTIKEEYPKHVLGQKIYVRFLTLSNPLSHDDLDSVRSEGYGISMDSLDKLDAYVRELPIYKLDSLAGVIPHVTFVLALRSWGKSADEKYDEYKSKTKNLLVLKKMNLLYSGFRNHRMKKKQPIEIQFIPSEFVINSKGEELYVRQNEWMWVNDLDPKLIGFLKSK